MNATGCEKATCYCRYGTLSDLRSRRVRVKFLCHSKSETTRLLYTNIHIFVHCCFGYELGKMSHIMRK